MKFLHHKLIPNGVLKMVALGTAIVGSALFGAREAKATPFLWDSYQDIVPTVNPNNGKPISSVSYTSESSVSIPNSLSAVYFIFASTGPKPVGGFDVRDGKVVSSSFNGYSTYYGLWAGDTANSGEGVNSQNHYPGYWEVFYDSDGNGNYGLADNSVAGVFLDRNEAFGDFNISNFAAYDPLVSGTFDFTATISAPSTCALAALNMASLGGGTNQLTLSVAVSNAVSFSITYKNSLTNATWESLGTFSKTGAVTIITDTNSVAQRFYRVVTP